MPGDKSISHRALLLAALAEGTSTITGLSDGDDVARTRRAVAALGAGVAEDGGDGHRSTAAGPACTPRAEPSTWATRGPACACWPAWSPPWPGPPP